MPAIFSVSPSDARSVLFVSSPAFCFKAPFSSCSLPSSCCLVLFNICALRRTQEHVGGPWLFFGQRDGANSVIDPFLWIVMHCRKSPHQLAVLQLHLPAQMLAALEIEIPIEIELCAVLFHLERCSRLAAEAQQL